MKLQAFKETHRRLWLFMSLMLLLGFLALLSSTSRFASGESSTCLTVYKHGGAPAVFRSQKCPRWTLPDSADRDHLFRSRKHLHSRCQSAMHQGRRHSQEDRTVCALDIRIPFPTANGVKEIIVGVVAVFDGHNGAEASEMASDLLLEYFVLHTYFLLDAAYSVVLKKSTEPEVLGTERGHDHIIQAENSDELIIGRRDSDFERFKNIGKFDDSLHLEILKEALLRALHDIDNKFSEEASINNINSGSTATVILLADGKILVANIGDSKAFLCYEKVQSSREARATFLRLYAQKRAEESVSRVRGYDKYRSDSSQGLTHYFVKELTRDHHPDRDDERARVEAAGGYVLDWAGVPRVNGQLALTRAIGDISFKSYGVTSAPEVTDWQPLNANDSYLVAASDGVFEKLNLQDVCDLLKDLHYDNGIIGSDFSSSCSCSLADCIVETAIEKGSMDNVAAVVVPMKSVSNENLIRDVEELEEKRGTSWPYIGLQEFLKISANEVASDLRELQHAHPNTKFNRILVEVKHGGFRCFYLSENLNENWDYTRPAKKIDEEDTMFVLDRALPEASGKNYENLNENWDYTRPAKKIDEEDTMFVLDRALPEASGKNYGGPLNLYNNQEFCFHLGMTSNGARDQCINPVAFASFFALLESIPLNDSASSNGSFDSSMPDSKYVLKKRFGRGSYGEVWLAFHWNCHQGGNISQWTEKNDNASVGPIKYNSFDRNKSNCCGFEDYPANTLFILKRIMVERGAAVYLSGLREKYFGEVFLNASTCLEGLLSGWTRASFLNSRRGHYDHLGINDSIPDDVKNQWDFENLFPDKFKLQNDVYEEGLNHIARYVESFESRSNEIWLVFHYEGVSLSKLIYSVEEGNSTTYDENAEQAKRVRILHPSKWWHWLKTTKAGQEEMRNLIWQLLLALKSCHDRNIIHRDIKPENMVICFEDQHTGRCLKESPSGEKNFTTKMRIIDFGSGIDEFTLKHFYGSSGPSRAEQTYEYAPPEALLNATWYLGPTSATLKYDMWSVGVVILELVLGTSKVFQISSITRALLDLHLDGWNEELKELAYRLRSFMELCILIPGTSSKHRHTFNQVGIPPASWKCSEEFFAEQIKSRDPLKMGFSDVWALRLVRNLLVWNPEDRLSVDDALRHPYFQPPP